MKLATLALTVLLVVAFCLGSSEPQVPGSLQQPEKAIGDDLRDLCEAANKTDSAEEALLKTHSSPALAKHGRPPGSAGVAVEV